MQKQEQQGIQKHRRKKSVWLIPLITVVVLFCAVLATSAVVLNKDTVYKGVSIGQIPAEGLTKTELQAMLSSRLNTTTTDLELKLTSGDISSSVNLAALGVTCDIEEAVNSAYSAGRSGSPFKRIADILSSASKGLEVSLSVSFSGEKLDDFIFAFRDKIYIETRNPVLSLSADAVTLTSGINGRDIDINAIRKSAADMLGLLQGGEIIAETQITPAQPIDPEELFLQLNTAPSSSSFKLVDGKVEVVPHTIGMSISINALRAAVNSLTQSEGKSETLPVEFVLPEFIAENAEQRLFSDTLSSFSSRFSTSNTNDKNRAYNIKLASSIIEGHILMPGEEFSFNKIVGPRSEAEGYKVAHTYVGGKVIDGIGGGICQVSSTLYGAVLKADLKVTSRRNHYFTVGYVPYGQDATVSYGSTDFKFVNSGNWPIRVDANVTSNNVYYTFVGTNDAPDKKVSLYHKTIETIPYPTINIDDPTLPAGTTKKQQSGKVGMIVESYKTVKIGDTVVSSGKITTSRYAPLPEEILVGPISPATPVVPPAADPAVIIGVDDADNPPAPLVP